jgi:CDP-diacylglycerol--glycerol-3-phosphate 3-phosphatidyltransferase
MGSTVGRDIRTAPNLITLSRILLVVISVVVFFHVSKEAGIVLATVAGVTDYLDGYVARRTGHVTRLGEILDQFCDLVFESFLLLVATVIGILPPLMLCAYLFREFWVHGLRRFMAAARMNIPSSLAGKLKTNLIMWGLLPTYLSIAGLLPGLEPYLGHFGRLAIGAGLVASYASAWGYTRIFLAGYARAPDRLD